MKRVIYIVLIALTHCACNKVENFLNETPETPVGVYHMSIPASFNAQTKGVTFNVDGTSISTQFKATDKFYVYNETKGAFARSADGDHPLSSLQPKAGSISASGISCTLEGDLSFYKLNNSSEWESVTIEGTDKYSIYYQMNDPDYVYPGANNIPRFDYSKQDGSASAASNCDFAEATGVTMILKDNTLTVPNTICFQNLQSMFRQRLSFTKGGVAVTPMPTITKLTIGTKNSTLLEYYRPNCANENGGEYWAFDGFDIDDPAITVDGAIFLSLAFYYTNDNPAAGDQLILTATDSEGNVYQGTKDVPTGGFQKSKYYHGSCTMVWQKQMLKPTITCSEGSSVVLGEYFDEQYDFYSGPSDEIKATISGNSTGYRLYFNDAPAFVTLTGAGNPVTATWTGQNAFIESDEDLTIILDCNYVIDNSAAYSKAIECGGELKLKTTGSTQTLTVITNDDGSFAYGIYGDSNWDCWMIPITGINNLAATDFTVTLSNDSPIDNGDNTYTWVYTVSPVEP